jgi:DNA-binding GntR family transcriptional regulator
MQAITPIHRRPLHEQQAQIDELAALQAAMGAEHARGDLAGYFRLNQAIHLKIVEASGNAVLANTYRQLNGNVLRARYMASLSRERWDEALREHERMLAAVPAALHKAA